MRLFCIRGDRKAAKILALINATDQNCEIVYIGEDTSTFDQQEFEKISPHGKSPALETGGEVLREANSILRIIAGRHKERGYAGIFEAEKAKIDEWLEYDSGTLDPLVQAVIDNREDSEFI